MTAANTAPNTTANTAPKIAHVILYGVVDLALVAVFAVIGRLSHHESVAGTIVTFWPFAVGLVVGWSVSRFWLDPQRINRVGIIIVAVTVVVGMLLRALSGQGVVPGFVVITTIVLGILLLGWRFAAYLIRRARYPSERATDIESATDIA